MKKMAMILAAGHLLAAPAYAGILDPLLGTPDSCFSRHYDAQHLEKHVGQRVTSIAISKSHAYQDSNFELTLNLVFTLRNGETYTITSLCDGNICGAEGDGGQFTLTPIKDGLRLDVDPIRGLGAEGPHDYSGNLHESDDKVFVLHRAGTASCTF